MATSSDSDEAVGKVIDVVDLVADQLDSEQEDVLLEALGKVRKRGGDE